MNNSGHVVMVAAENDALVGGKVGGVADVVRDLSAAVADEGWKVTTIVPSYGFLHTRTGAVQQGQCRFPFRGKIETAEVWEVTPRHPHPRVTHLAIEHLLLRGEPIYYDDPSDRPFSRDATKYAAFCSATGQWLMQMDSWSVLHLHDWHTGFLFLLRGCHPDFAGLQSATTAFTIHNLSLQGTRPMMNDESSVESWFPELFASREWIDRWKDARYSDPCFTPIAAGIRYSDRVNTVSPGYAREILRPNDPTTGFHGGEGLEQLLLTVKQSGKFTGILNGCAYSNRHPAPKLPPADLASFIFQELQRSGGMASHPMLAETLARLDLMHISPPAYILTSITRVVSQKVGLFFEQGSDGVTPAQHIVELLESTGGAYIVLGNGLEEYEEKFWSMVRASTRVVFLHGYLESIASTLYASGDLFLMPSLFEPCGISQMLAMRDGQVCLVHAVGGLKDTVIDGENGFTFSGSSNAGKADQFVQTLRRAVDMLRTDRQWWEERRSKALQSRFTWSSSARHYIRQLYA